MIPKQGLFHILYPDCFIVVFILCEAQYLWYLRRPLTYGVCWMKRLSRVIPLSSSIWNPKNIRFRSSILYLCDIICLHHLFLPCVPPTNLFTVYFLTKSHFSWGKAVWSLAANGSIALMALHSVKWNILPLHSLAEVVALECILRMPCPLNNYIDSVTMGR